MQLSIAGRYLVYMPAGAGSARAAGSRRPSASGSASCCRTSTRATGGVIVRTAAQGARKADFERDIEYLRKLYEVVQRRSDEVKAPEMVFQEADLSIRVLRDVLDKEFDGAIIDDAKQHHRVTSFFQRTAPELVDEVELYTEREPLFEQMGVEEAYRSVLSRRVDLPSGGYLMIDYAEALTVIDVNTGSFTGRGKGRLEDTITRVNVEAAEEVVRQLRLRDIGGIIVIDFIDMARARNRDQVLKTLRKALDADKTKSYVMDVSPLGLVEMTRQNVTDGVREILTKRCPTCDGEGVVESEETVAIQVVRRLRDMVAEQPEATPEAFLVRVNPGSRRSCCARTAPCTSSRRSPASNSTSRAARRCRSTPSRWSSSGTRAEIEERALPFQVGDEVLVRSRSRTCTTSTTRSPGSTATSSAWPGAARSWATGAWCGSRASAAPRRPRRWSALARPTATAVTRRRRGRRGFRRIAALPDGAAADEAAGAVARGQRQNHRTARAPSGRRMAGTSYAIVETGGKQYRAEKGGSLVVEHLPADEGARSSLRASCTGATRQVVVDGDQLEKVKVEAVVAEHLRGPKVRIFKYKAKKGYRRAPAIARS